MSAVREKLITALCNVAHDINDETVVIRFNPRLPGNNALNQLLTALEAQFEAPPQGGAP